MVLLVKYDRVQLFQTGPRCFSKNWLTILAQNCQTHLVTGVSNLFFLLLIYHYCNALSSNPNMRVLSSTRTLSTNNQSHVCNLLHSAISPMSLCITPINLNKMILDREIWHAGSSKTIQFNCESKRHLKFISEKNLLTSRWCKLSALTLLVGRQEGHPACKNWVVGC